MTSKVNNVRLGLLLGLLAPALTMLIVYLVGFADYGFNELIDLLLSKKVFTKLLSLCVIPNLALFFLFLNKNYYYSARGVLLATVLFALFVFITKFTL